MARSVAVLVFVLLAAGPARAGLDSPPAPPQDLTSYAKKIDVPGLAPVTSVTGQTGSIVLPTVCGNASIPAGNTVANTATETAFATTCAVSVSATQAGNALHLHVGGVYSAGTAQSARGRVRFTQAGTPNLASDATLIDTGAVGGLAASTNQEWFGDIWITFQTGSTAIDAQGVLTFQTGANATATVPVANTTTFAIDPTKPVMIYLTVAWGAAMTVNSMQLRTMVAK